MAAPSIDTAFVKQFESEVHLAYQRMGAKMGMTVRNKTNVKGESTTFQKLGSGTAGTKTRHGQVPILNLAHTNVECTIGDYYAGEYVDKLDELKIEHDERDVAAKSIAAALGRKSDALVVAAADTTSNTTATAGALTEGKVEEIFEYFGNNDVPDDGDRYLWVSPQGWTDLMGITSFASADYVGADDLPFKGNRMTAKNWYTFTIMIHSGLTKAGAIRNSLAWHKTALGRAVQQEPYTDITWQGKEQSNLVVGGMAEGACLIDSTGCYILAHTEA